MDWNKLIVLGGQVIALIALTALVALGHDGAILDALMVVVGSIAGQGILHSVSSIISIKPLTPDSAQSTPTLTK